MLHKASSIRLLCYSSLCKHGPMRQYFGALASGVQLGRAGILARRLVRVKITNNLNMAVVRAMEATLQSRTFRGISYRCFCKCFVESKYIRSGYGADRFREIICLGG